MAAPPPPYTLGRPVHGNEYLGYVQAGFIAPLVAIASIAVVLRVFTRVWVQKSPLWWDDHFIILAGIANCIGASLDAVEVHFGFGRHEFFITDHMLRWFLAYTYGEWIQTFFTLMCTKVSICFLLLRLPVTRALIIPLQIAVAVLIVSNLVFTFTWIFQCWPIRAVWERSVHGKCLSHQQLWDIVMAQAIVSVLSDFGLAFYPFLILRKLQMTTRYKVGCCLLMGLGVITGACCVVRTVLNDGALASDSTYGGITNWFWRLFEVNLGIICACVPPLAPLYKWSRGRLTAMSQSRSRSGSIFKPWTLRRPSTNPLSDQSRVKERSQSMPLPKHNKSLAWANIDTVSSDVEACADTYHLESMAPAVPPKVRAPIETGPALAPGISRSHTSPDFGQVIYGPKDGRVSPASFARAESPSSLERPLPAKGNDKGRARWGRFLEPIKELRSTTKTSKNRSNGHSRLDSEDLRTHRTLKTVPA